MVALKLKYGGKLRYVFMKDLMREGNATLQQEQFVSMDDTAGQQQLLNNGFVGRVMKKTGDNWLVHYVK